MYSQSHELEIKGKYQYPNTMQHQHPILHWIITHGHYCNVASLLEPTKVHFLEGFLEGFFRRGAFPLKMCVTKQFQCFSLGHYN